MMKVSVIIPVYNCEKYIENAILSVVNQNLKDIQIIIINDGSTDGSVLKCKKLQQKYSFIELYEQKNNGPSAARNLGIMKATGKYITFLDGDDYIPNKIFKTIYKSIEKNKADIFIGNILCFNDVTSWHLLYMKKVFNRNKKIVVGEFKDLKQVVETASVCNKWFRNELIKENKIIFEEDIKIAEDFLFTQSALINSNKILLKDIDSYAYRLGRKSSLINGKKVEFFSQLLKSSYKLVDIYINSPISINESLIRQLGFFVDSIFLKYEELSVDEIEHIMKLGIELFNICENIELDRKMFKSLERYLLAEVFKQKDFNGAIKLSDKMNSSKEKKLIIQNGRYYSYLITDFEKYRELLELEPVIETKVENSYIKDDNLIIRGYAFIRGINFNECLDIKRTLVIREIKEGKSIRLAIDNDYRTDLTYIFKNDNMNYNWAGYKPISINIESLPPNIYEIYMEISLEDKIYEVQFEYRLAEIKNKLKVKYLSNKRELFCRFKESKYLQIRIQELSRKQYIKSKLRLLRRSIRYDISLIKNKKYNSFIILYLYRLFGWYYRKQNIWLMGERADTAQDNTYHLFKYLKSERKDLNIKYLINKNSSDVKKIKKYGDVIWFNSIAHNLHLLTCKYTINSYAEKANMYTKEYIDIMKFYPEFRKNKKVFLQHGVIGVSRVNHVLHKNRMDYDLFIVSSQFEKEHIVNEFGYDTKEVVVTGLARWDNLNDGACKNKILLMPTWRSWIKSKDELRESEYFNTILMLLSNKKFQKILKDKGYDLTFYPHYKIQKLLEDMDIELGNNIKIAKFEGNEVQKLINENYILITDYSTVAFDFAYCSKPTIFYQFDYKKFYSDHYNEGPINHKTELFGTRVENQKELLDLISSDKVLKYSVDIGTKYIYKKKEGKICKIIADEIDNI